MSTTDVMIRLIAAFVVGGALGLNRDLHGKPAGVRTIGIVSLGAAMLVLAAGNVGPGQLASAGLSPIIQGIMTGIGFLGAGVIVRGKEESTILGLTTAASIWLAAGLGILAGLGEWIDLVIGTGLVFMLLVFGGPAERWVHRTFEPAGRAAKTNDDGTPSGGEPLY
jgi:putative Mg2+ transporter-C (MgtC) family protein